jgi:hypothetical protein
MACWTVSRMTSVASYVRSNAWSRSHGPGAFVTELFSGELHVGCLMPVTLLLHRREYNRIASWAHMLSGGT